MEGGAGAPGAAGAEAGATGAEGTGAAGAAGTAAANTAISMYGDFFGSGTQTLTISRPPLNVLQSPIVTPSTMRTQTFTLSPVFSANTVYSGTQSLVFTPTSSPVTLGNTTVGNSPTFKSVLTFPNSTTTFPTSLGLTATGSTLSSLNAAAAAQAHTGEQAPTLVSINADPVTFSSKNPDYVVAPINATYDYVTPSSISLPLPILVPQPPMTVLLPSAATGAGLVGLTKVSEDNSPLPRDRLIFEYDYYNDVPFTASGVNVHRFAPGFEKTFFDRRASIEVRLPFAATLNSDLQAEGITNQTAVLGDLHLVLKGLAYTSQVLNFAGGLAFDLPTSPNLNILGPDGNTLVRIKDEALLVTPFVAYLWTPNNYFFFQNWYEVVFDTNGNPVAANSPGSGLVNVGRVHQQNLVEIDAQVGAWVYRTADYSAIVNGIAPFLELHYNSTINSAELINAGAFNIGATIPNFSELNLSAGFLTQVCNTLLVTVGASVPLLGNQNRSFDYEVGVRASLFFGPTARNITRAVPISSF